MPGCSAVRDNGHRFVGRVSRIVLHLYIQYGRQTAKTLCANTQIINLFEQFQTQLFSTIGSATRLQIMNIDRIE